MWQLCTTQLNLVQILNIGLQFRKHYFSAIPTIFLPEMVNRKPLQGGKNKKINVPCKNRRQDLWIYREIHSLTRQTRTTRGARTFRWRKFTTNTRDESSCDHLFFFSRNSIILIFAAQSCFLLYTQWIGEFLCFVFVYFCIERRCLCLCVPRVMAISDLVGYSQQAREIDSLLD